MLFLLFPVVSEAQSLLQGISAVLEFNYNFFSSKTTDSSGSTSKVETNTYNPRFTLSINANIFPKLRLDAGGVFEKNISILESDVAGTIRTNLTRLRPYFFLTLTDPLYTAGIGYSRREEKIDISGGPGVTTISDDYTGNLLWKPDGFPSIESQFGRTNTFDEKKILLDTTKDIIFVTSRYDYKGLNLKYSAAYTDAKDKLNHLEVQDLVQTGWVNYSNSFFDRRVSLNTSYIISHDQTRTSKEGTGGVSVQVIPFAGLSINFNAGAVTHSVALNPNPALIDGNLIAGAGVDIGLPPLGGDSSQRNIGLDFVNPTEVNQLLVWVDRDLSSAPAIANSFSWDVYISSDNLNWTHHAGPILPAPFGPFQNRFEINFAGATARYIKVVTSPLSPAVPGASGFPNIFITELQAFIKRPAEEVRGKTTRTSHIYNLDVTARVLDIPTLFYNLSFFYNRTDPSGQDTYTLSNGLSTNHRFSQILVGTARVAIENGKQADETRVAYVYDASLVVTPLKTLINRLAFSGRDETIEGNTSTNHSLFLYNSAQLHKGLDVNLNGGLNYLTSGRGQSQMETSVNFSVGVVPHPTTNLSLAYIYSNTDRSGGGQEASSTFTHTGNATLSYNPFKNLYLVASVEVIAEKSQKIRTNQNYGLNWSPFPDGTLQFRFFYNESLESFGSGKSRIISPGVRWYLTRRSYLDVSYQKIMTESSSGKTDSNAIGASLRIIL